MDFVDLDKVLDQFEEEEKAAGELQPGQETTPSGYAEYLASHQDRPWEVLSYATPSDSTSLKQHHHGHHNSHSITYDDPYDNYSLDQHSRILGGGQGVFSGSKQTDSLNNVHAKNTLNSDYYHTHNGLGHPGSGPSVSQPLTEGQLTRIKLKQETIESYLPLQQNLNGHDQTTGVNGAYDAHTGLKKGDEGERRGLIASQPASIQTDVLSPTSEQELWSSPYPKSDITVVGHDESPQYTSADGNASESGECASMQNGTGSSYSVVSSIEPNRQMTDQHFSAPSTAVTHPPRSDSLVAESQQKLTDQVVESKSSDEGRPKVSDAVAVGDAASAKLEVKSVSETAEINPEGLAGTEENSTVGFNMEEGEVDQDEVNAYLQELDENINSGCEGAVTGQSTFTSTTRMTEALDTSQNQMDHNLSQNEIPAEVPESVDHFISSPDASAADVSEAMETEHVTENVIIYDIPQSSDMPDVSEPQGDGPQIMDTDDQPSCSTDKMDEITEMGCADSNNSSMSDHGSPDIIADTGRVTAVSRRRPPTESAQPMEVSESGLRHEDSLSLDFPVTGAGSELSSIVKGKLEIESLLDEAVAARLAQKQAEANRIGPTPPPVEPVRNMDTVSVMPESSRPDGSQTFDSRGTSHEGSAGGDSSKDPATGNPSVLGGSPSPILGIGARPKDPNQMKKNRPNSLLGLSKISLGAPFSPPQAMPSGPQTGEAQVPTGPQHPGMDGGRPQPFSMHSGDHMNPSETVLGPQSQQYHVDARHLGAPPPVVGTPAPDVSAPVPVSGVPVPGSAGAVQASDLDAPVMRRQDSSLGGDVGEGVEASCGGQRPRSWSPSTVASPPPAQKMKRPTSLNLPVRQDFNRGGNISPDGDGTRTRKAEHMQDMGMANDTGSSEDDSMAIGDADGGSSGGADAVEGEGAAAAAGMQFETQPPSILHMNLGKVAPTWVPDAEAPTCMECEARFTFTKRRHHCRACGKVFCSNCCNLKSRLAYQDKEGRVCISCHQLLAAAESCGPAAVACRSPNPNNPTEYCSTIPPPQQANARAPLPTVMVPTGVLKREGSNRKSEPKQVMFSDGIRPGGDLTELDGSDQARLPPRRTGRVQKKVERQQGEHASPKTRRLRGGEGIRNPCLIPEEGLPPIVVATNDKGDVQLAENPDQAALMAQIRNEEANPVMFSINCNLFVLVKIINLDCCVNRVVWCFTTRGMITVGQEEIVMVLETLPDEDTIPMDIFNHFSTVYDEAGKGNTVTHMGHSIFNQQFLDSRGHGGFLYLRASFQCTKKLVLPEPPFLFAILLQKWETPWAKVFPIRLMLRLGAEYRYYPCPLVSIRNRKPVFYEIGHTIMNLLADFRNFQYMLPQIRGITIHMEDKKTCINLPRNRYEDVMKVVSDSNEHVMAMGASFSMEADSHLVCIQNEEGNYQTQAINIQNKPRQVTGASFVVFNGALKSSSGLHAKSSIVEDGLMVQIMPEMMAALKQSMKDMVNFNIGCGSVSVPQPEEMVMVHWVDDDKQINMGVKSPVDGMAMDGIESIHIHNATDYVGEHYAIRWTEVFFLQTESGISRWEPVDLSRVAETLASAVSIALTPHLDQLKQAGLTKIGLRVTLEPERVGYEIGSNSERLPDFYMNDLDNALIPVIHGAITQSREGPIVLELILHVIH